MHIDTFTAYSPEELYEGIRERGIGENTGLGLFMTREILGITGIAITENGEPGKGARFEIAVPRGHTGLPKRIELPYTNVFKTVASAERSISFPFQ